MQGAAEVWHGGTVRIEHLPTPCLLLDRQVLLHNLQRMQTAVSALGVALRPHMGCAKSIDVALLAAEVARNAGGTLAGIAVSTLAEAEYFAGHDLTDILYTVAITPQKLDQIGKLNAAGAEILVVTDDPDGAAAIAGHTSAPRALIEIDTGAGRGGLLPDDPALPEIAALLGRSLAGVMTHAAQAYDDRGPDGMMCTAEVARAGVARAAARLAAAGHQAGIVSMGSTQAALPGTDLDGVTELCAGAYMFGDLERAAIGSSGPADMALTVLASVIGRRSAQLGRPGRVLLDAGAIALSKDRSTHATPLDLGRDLGFGLMLDHLGERRFGHAVVRRVWQEHALVELDPLVQEPTPMLGQKVRLLTSHACLTAAAHDRYFVVDGSPEVAEIWPRIGGW